MYGTVYPSMLSLHPPCHVFATDCPRLILASSVSFTSSIYYRQFAFWYRFLIYLVLVVHFSKFLFSSSSYIIVRPLSRISTRVYCNAMLIVL